MKPTLKDLENAEKLVAAVKVLEQLQDVQRWWSNQPQFHHLAAAESYHLGKLQGKLDTAERSLREAITHGSLREQAWAEQAEKFLYPDESEPEVESGEGLGH